MEKLRCECASKPFLLWNVLQRCRLYSCSQQQPALGLFFSSVSSPSCVTHERLLWLAPTPAMLKFLHVLVTLSSSQVFHVVATLLKRLSEPAAKTFPKRNQLPAFNPPYLSLSQPLELRLLLLFYVFWICGSVWPRERSMPMWLSSPQGTVQVSRPGWRIQALSVTNAFGWSAGPRGTLFQCSVGTWQQSPQELFKWDKLYQSQPMLLHAHPSPLNHTFETRWSSFSLCPILLFMCFPSLSRVGQQRALGNKAPQNISKYLSM